MGDMLSYKLKPMVKKKQCYSISYVNVYGQPMEEDTI